MRGFIQRAEPWIAWVLGALGLAAVPLAQGQASLVWDALNHHVYLGWIAEQPRFHRDFLAAGWQSFQYPYLYWPAYKLAVSGASGVVAGVAFALMQSLAVPALWLVSRSLCPGPRAQDMAWRALAVALALSGSVTLSLVETTSNDMLAGIPLVWAIALGFVAHDCAAAFPARALRLVALSGVLAGVSVAFKLSNGPLALVMPALWLWGPGGAAGAFRRVMLGGFATIAGFLAAFAPWGVQMWRHFGNPLYPLYDPVFEPLRQWTGWVAP